jgi:hypothetical protein
MTRLPTTKSGDIATLTLLGSFAAGSIALLHRLGEVRWMTIQWGSLRSWIETTPIEDVVAAGLRSVALLLAYWVAASSAAYAAARISRLPRLIRATSRATLPPIRRLIDQVVAVTATAAAFTSPIAPALASEVPSQRDPIVYQISDRGIPSPINPPSADPTVILPPGIGGAGYTPEPAGGVTIDEDTDIAEPVAALEPGGRLRATIHVVVAGDNLWAISAAHLLSLHPDGEVAAGEIATYWRRVIEANRASLHSGNPNLIYPGEQIVLPGPG